MGFAQFTGHGPIPGWVASGDAMKDPAGYRASAELARAVNVALALRMPLLVTGDPGTGKTQLAYRVAAELALGPVLRFNTKSSSAAQELFYTFDAVRQFAQSQLEATAGRPLPDARQFLRPQALGRAILCALHPEEVERQLGAGHRHAQASRSVVLIDEIDKAPRDFPNDLLNQIEEREFHVPELDAHFRAPEAMAPVVVISSNSERQLPEAFLRRCVYHHIEFPRDLDELQQILGDRLKALDLGGPRLVEAVRLFFRVREEKAFSRSPSTSELLDWLRALKAHGLHDDQPLEGQTAALLAAAGSLFKTREDLDHARRLFAA
jgi:MoxR-like ATPase